MDDRLLHKLRRAIRKRPVATNRQILAMVREPELSPHDVDRVRNVMKAEGSILDGRNGSWARSRRRGPAERWGNRPPARCFTKEGRAVRALLLEQPLIQNKEVVRQLKGSVTVHFVSDIRNILVAEGRLPFRASALKNHVQELLLEKPGLTSKAIQELLAPRVINTRYIDTIRCEMRRDGLSQAKPKPKPKPKLSDFAVSHNLYVVRVEHGQIVNVVTFCGLSASNGDSFSCSSTEGVTCQACLLLMKQV